MLKAANRVVAFLVDTKNQGFNGRIQVKADAIREFFYKVLVAAELEGFDQMRFQIMLTPNSLNGHPAQALGLRHCAHTPVSSIRRLCMESGFDHSANLSLGNVRESTRTRSVLLQTGEAKSQKTLSPELNGGSRCLDALSKLLVQDPVGRHLNALGPLHQTQRKTSSLGPCVQCFTFLGRQDNGLGYSHAGDHRAYFNISKEINGTLH